MFRWWSRWFLPFILIATNSRKSAHLRYDTQSFLSAGVHCPFCSSSLTIHLYHFQEYTVLFLRKLPISYTFFLQVSVLSWLFMYFQRIVLLISERNTGLEKWFYLSLWLLLLLYVLYACVDNKHIGMLTSACVCTCRSEFDMKMSSLIIWTHQFF